MPAILGLLVRGLESLPRLRLGWAPQGGIPVHAPLPSVLRSLRAHQCFLLLAHGSRSILSIQLFLFLVKCVVRLVLLWSNLEHLAASHHLRGERLLPWIGGDDHWVRLLVHLMPLHIVVQRLVAIVDAGDPGAMHIVEDIGRLWVRNRVQGVHGLGAAVRQGVPLRTLRRPVFIYLIVLNTKRPL